MKKREIGISVIVTNCIFSWLRMYCFCPYVYRDGDMGMKNGKCQNNSWIAKLLHLFWNEIAL